MYANAEDASLALDADTLAEALLITAGRAGTQPALRDLDGHVLDWRTYRELALSLAAALGDRGLRHGSTLGLMLRNRPELHVADCAALQLGAIPFSIYNTSAPEQISQIVANAGCELIVCESTFASRLLAAGVRPAQLIVVGEGVDGTLSYEELVRGGGTVDVERAAQRVRADDVATLIYTSGTTGPPKGVEVTHRNVLANWRATHQVLPLRARGRLVSYLPTAHIADRFLAHYAGLVSGACVTCVADMGRLDEALAATRPTSFGAVPRTWQKWAAQHQLAERTPSDDLRVTLGLDRADWLVCGAAPVAPALLDRFAEHGVQISELFGMSELGCVVCVNPPAAIRVGTVGPPLPGVEVRLQPDGELLVRSASVMRGYRDDPQRTAEAIDGDGFLQTGDIARVDADGYVTIVDRKKELIINAAGKNMSPANIERALETAGPLIDRACAIGDGRPYNVALVQLDRSAVPGAVVSGHDVNDAVQAEIDRANATLARVEQIKRFAIIERQWDPGIELTPTLKLRRRVIAERYAPEIDALYRSPIRSKEQADAH